MMSNDDKACLWIISGMLAALGLFAGLVSYPTPTLCVVGALYFIGSCILS
jgi:hypothetical protein